MQIEIGNHVYTVRLVKHPLRDDAGEIVSGLASWYRGEVLISDHVPLEKRRHVLVHELWHQWTNHFGAGAAETVADPEAEANQVASFSEMVVGQIDPNELATLRTEPQPAWLAPAEDWPPPEPGPGASAATATRRETKPRRVMDELRNTCPVCLCGRPLALGAVVDGEVVEDPVVGRHREREGYCARCDHAIAWPERVSPSGYPTGIALAGPRYITGNELLAWKDANPTAVSAAQGAYE